MVLAKPSLETPPLNRISARTLTAGLSVELPCFIDSLRSAFNAADPERAGFLTPSQWDSSNLRKGLRDGQLSDDEFRKYFHRSDANSTGAIH
jgi:hypothetical protein